MHKWSYSYTLAYLWKVLTGHKIIIDIAIQLRLKRFEWPHYTPGLETKSSVWNVSTVHSEVTQYRDSVDMAILQNAKSMDNKTPRQYLHLSIYSNKDN